MRKVLIQARRLSRVYVSATGAVHGLRDVDLTLTAGEYAVLLGPAGAGKSTLLRILGFRERATGGDLFYMGRLATALTDLEMAMLREREIGFIEGAGGEIDRVLARRPPLLLADEPVSGLARSESRALLQLLQQLNADGQTILLTTDDPEVAAFGKNLYRMSGGILRPIGCGFRH